MANRAEYLKHQYEGSVGLPLARLLPPNWLEQAMEEQGYSYRESVYRTHLGS